MLNGKGQEFITQCSSSLFTLGTDLGTSPYPLPSCGHPGFPLPTLVLQIRRKLAFTQLVTASLRKLALQRLESKCFCFACAMRL